MGDKPVRYIVYIPNQEFPISYNLALGRNALVYAKITAKQWHGAIIEELPNGEFKEYKNYNKDKNLIN